MKPLVLSEATDRWLMLNAEAVPDCLWVDLYQIALHNQKCEEILGLRPAKVPLPPVIEAPPLIASAE